MEKSVEVILPDIGSVPEKWRGKTVKVSQLLSPGDSNAKLTKSDLSGKGYLTYGLALAPAKESGYQMCPKATQGCTKACLHHQGRARVWETIKLARIAKTVAFHERREWFMAKLRRELDGAVRRAEKEEKRVAFRPNLFSDVRWEKLSARLFADFPEVQSYDYSKLPAKALDFAAGKLPTNYHVTFSRSENNEDDCLRVLKAGGNVAVVFLPPLPRKWMGYKVIDGDETDLRFLDPENVVVGLKAKGSARSDDSGFVVRPRGGKKKEEKSRRVALAMA